MPTIDTESKTASLPISPIEEVVAGLSNKSWRRLSYAVLTVFSLLIPFIFEGFAIYQFTIVAIYAMAILGLNLLTGFNGQISLCHGVFYAIGAYLTAIMVNTFGMHVYLSIPIAAVICLIIGFLFGLPVTRLEGLWLATATFALAFAFPQILKSKHIEQWTGGVQGLDVFKPDVPFGLPLGSDQWAYFVVLLVLILMFWFANNLIKSRSGRTMLAIRDNPIAAKSMGINLTFHKALVFGISAFYGGMAGAFSAMIVEFVAPDSFTYGLSFLFLIGMIMGGMSSVIGALIGGYLLMFLPSIAEDVSKNLAGAMFGLILILIMYVAPNGTAGFFSSLLARLRSKLKSQSPAKTG